MRTAAAHGSPGFVAYNTSAPSRPVQASCTALLLVTSTPLPSTEYAVSTASGWSGVSNTPLSCNGGGGEGGGGEGGGEGGGGDGGGGDGGGEGGEQ